MPAAASGSSGSAAPQELTKEQVQNTFKQIEAEINMLINKIAELEQEINEHVLVLKAFEKVEPERRCFRMIGGVLVERTVAEVKPAIESNREKIKQAVGQIEAQLKLKTEQRTQFIEKHGLNKEQTKGAGLINQAHEKGASTGGSVLV
mmetsp:Transcript_3737/g.9534  ORF Transcript_3737/g.9534 Transcript_3737/m.9534 type:complete len:148 (-) Transcript_3737:37-480(-)